MKRKVLVTLCLCMIGLLERLQDAEVKKKEETPVVEEEKKNLN